MPSLPFRTRSDPPVPDASIVTPVPATTATAPAQAGGGVPPQFVPAAHEIYEFQPMLAEYGRMVESRLGKQYDLSTSAGFSDFVANEQGQDVADWEAWESGKGGPDRFLNYLVHSSSDALAPPDLAQSLSLPMSNYFISSSHNTYLSGHQLYGEASTDPYKNVLLRGCRCVEIDVWDGDSEDEDDADDEAVPDRKKRGLREGLREGFRERFRLRKGEKKTSEQPAPTLEKQDSNSEKIKPWRTPSNRAEPQVLHGHTLTRKIPFREVCEAIRDYAFVTSDLPVIVSLEVHTCAQQQQMMVDIMEKCWKSMLVDVPAVIENNTGNGEVPLPSPQELRKKILIKVKYSPPKPPPEVASAEPKHALKKELTASSSASSLDDQHATKENPEKKSKIIDALSELGFYTRSVHFKGFDQPEASIPTHVFSLSERTLMEAHQQTPIPLFKHNKCYLMRAYPKGTRIGSSNLDPCRFWRQGVQIVALNWQKWDAGTMLNEAMFAGYGGWVLKPAGYRSSSIAEQQTQAASCGLLNLSVEFFAGQNIPLPPEHEPSKILKPFVKVEIHVGNHSERREDSQQSSKAKEVKYKQHTKTSKSQHPDFKREFLLFEQVSNVVPELSFLRFKVMHDVLGTDDLAAWACIRLDRLRQGYRLIHLYDAHGMQSKGVLFVKIKSTFYPQTG